jgi:hypothetical protein
MFQNLSWPYGRLISEQKYSAICCPCFYVHVKYIVQNEQISRLQTINIDDEMKYYHQQQYRFLTSIEYIVANGRVVMNHEMGIM